MVVFISVDIEGVATLVQPEQVNVMQGSFSSSLYERARLRMTEEIRAAMMGAYAASADHIIVNDSHSRMINFLPELLPEEGEYIQGSPKPLGMMQGIERGVDCAFFIGYHASAGAGNAVLDHTSNDRIHQLKLNGVAVGEFGMNLALAGHFKVPVVLVSGDNALVTEAKALQSRMETVVTKEGISRTAACCTHPAIVDRKLEEAANRAIQRVQSGICDSYSITPPIIMEVGFHTTCQADMAQLIPGSIRTEGRVVRWTGDDMEIVYRTYRAMLALSSVV
jgi:D-amino peptidase